MQPQKLAGILKRPKNIIQFLKWLYQVQKAIFHLLLFFYPHPVIGTYQVQLDKLFFITQLNQKLFNKQKKVLTFNSQIIEHDLKDIIKLLARLILMSQRQPMPKFKKILDYSQNNISLYHILRIVGAIGCRTHVIRKGDQAVM